MHAGESAGEEVARSLRKAQQARKSAEYWEQRAAKFARGRVGETAVAQALEELTTDGYLRLDDCAWPGRPKANIDHVLIGPAGLFVIDAKNWSGRVEVRNGVLRQNGYKRSREVDSVRDATHAVIAALPFASPRVGGLLALAGSATLAPTAVGTTTVASIGHLVAWVRSQPAVLWPELVQQGYTALSRALTRRCAALSPVVTTPIPATVPAEWSAPAPARPAPAWPTSATRRVVAPKEPGPRSSKGSAVLGRVLLIFVILDAITAAAVTHSGRFGNLAIAVLLTIWLARLESKRSVLGMSARRPR